MSRQKRLQRTSKNFFLINNCSISLVRWLAIGLCLTGLVSVSLAYEHQESLVDFEEYSEDVIADTQSRGKPYFLLFSAEWCHWCHEFSEQTLTRQDVADYLNRHFTNVFIDVDIQDTTYVKYRAVGVPFTVFLNPDGSLYYKYGGTLYGDDFLDVIKEVSVNAGSGKTAFGTESAVVSYEPSLRLSVDDLLDFPVSFRRGVLDNVDSEEYGLGRGQKSILPRTFLYLLETGFDNDRKEAVDWLTKTMERAIENIYDPVEGGFFRYAETRDWRVPHYEKFSDLNAGSVLLLYRLNEITPSPSLIEAADTTLRYLTSTLFDSDLGCFLNIQVADTYYYFFNEKQRKTIEPPKVMDKIFSDRLAATLNYLIEVNEYVSDAKLEKQVIRSLDFLEQMIQQDQEVHRYFSVPGNLWSESGGLSDYAHLAHLFIRAASRFENLHYSDVASRLVHVSISKFYDEINGVFIEPTIGSNGNVEYLMSLNGLLVQAMISLGDRLDEKEQNIIERVITYYSLMGEVLEDRLWDAVDWDFTENYVAYLAAIDQFDPD